MTKTELIEDERNEDDPTPQVFVLSWRLDDGSAMGVERVYADRKRAADDLALLKKSSYREWHLDEIEIT